MLEPCRSAHPADSIRRHDLDARSSSPHDTVATTLAMSEGGKTQMEQPKTLDRGCDSHTSDRITDPDGESAR